MKKLIIITFIILSSAVTAFCLAAKSTSIGYKPDNREIRNDFTGKNVADRHPAAIGTAD
ncbi:MULTISPECIES: hypothetical protein [unclassified Mucilaginibacter]|uniref:hypothetical protein n=1 Tax=unclassified Mucilaginibacter TaxID=2617802 RepID=UPI000A569218|nr:MULTISPECIES: hypothetical protein [unclassified Mucilaginibacter]